MSDRKLLELAAKVAGRSFAFGKDWHDEGQIYLDGRQWNPLTDDGDALRLAVKLKLEVGVWFDTTRVESDEAESAVEKHLADPYAATRRAIVRAAAEIGKEMP